MSRTPLRILYVSHSFPLPDDPLSNVGGMQRVAVALYRTLSGRDDVVVTPLLLETSWKMTSVRTGPFLLRLVQQIPRIVREKQIDVVLFSSMVTASALLLAGDRVRKAGATTAAIPVGRDVTLPNPLYQRLVPRVLKTLDLVLPISRATAAECIARGADPTKVHIIPCGVEAPGGGMSGSREDERKRILDLLRERGVTLPTGTLLLLSVGRHQERKGFHWFVDAVMPTLREDAVYLLAGSGPMTAAIEERIRARKLSDRVILLGQVAEEVLSTLYSGADLFIMPNIPVPGDIEGFGVVMIEAGAGGLPVVAAGLEGIRDVISEGVNGTLVESGDANGFAKAIAAYRDPAVLSAASARAKEHVEANFGWPAVAQRHVEVLRKLAAISGRGRGPASTGGGTGPRGG